MNATAQKKGIFRHQLGYAECKPNEYSRYLHTAAHF